MRFIDGSYGNKLIASLSVELFYPIIQELYFLIKETQNINIISMYLQLSSLI